MHKFRSTWFTVAVSSLGKFGGLMVAWNLDLFDLRPYMSRGGILLVACTLATKQELAFLNVYGPCSDKLSFWMHLASSGLLAIPNLILGGDLNFILLANEHWGGPFLPGPAEATVKDIIASNNLIDIQPIRMVPTWRNGRSGPDAIAKCLDRFMVAEGLLSSFVSSSSWVEFPYLSDHAPILLQLIPTVCRLTPFKFDHNLLTSKNYSAIVHSTWTDPGFRTESNPQSRLIWKLKELKSITIHWEKAKIKEEKANLLLLETQISTLIYNATRSALTVEETDTLKLLEAHRVTILREEEFR